MQEVSTKYNAMCVHLSIKATSLSGVSGIGMRHTIQMPMTKVKVTGYVRKKCETCCFICYRQCTVQSYSILFMIRNNCGVNVICSC